jgi:hypothetical protein
VFSLKVGVVKLAWLVSPAAVPVPALSKCTVLRIVGPHSRDSAGLEHFPATLQGTGTAVAAVAAEKAELSALT